MLEIPSTYQTEGGSLNGSGNLAGLDLLTSIQILLVQDYDNQLKHLGKQMKVANAVKRSYREVIENHQKILPRETKEIGEHKDWIKVSREEYDKIINQDQEFVGNEFADTAKDFVMDHGKAFPKEGAIEIKTEGHETFVRRSVIEDKVAGLNTKLDTVNEQSEMMSLKLQSLTNQRKIAFESISNILRKESDTLNTMVRNMVN